MVAVIDHIIEALRRDTVVLKFLERNFVWPGLDQIEASRDAEDVYKRQAQDHAHGGDQRGDDAAGLAVHLHGAGLVVLQAHGHGQVAALANQVLQGGFLAVQRCV